MGVTGSESAFVPEMATWVPAIRSVRGSADCKDTPAKSGTTGRVLPPEMEFVRVTLVVRDAVTGRSAADELPKA